ncbi:hypothetical protein BSL78_16608 [Apostichopus japonicus]|uniref:Uncharacterized protein n=1 Tax=Stichopus japonicus TaxID=307972 RepID=A0A2G8KEX0_STIJA|nr:hypothetical protein BSL78_16608 [Apostichopus japonicus]
MPDLVPKNQNPLREEATSVDHVEEKLPIDVSSRKRKLQGVAWKNLSQREKQETVEELLATISYTLGPRERLEVARILDTDGDISGVSYVLSIDPENLPEEKVTLIQNLLEEATDDAKTRDWRHMQQERSSKVKRESTSKGILPKSRMQKCGNTLRRNLSRLTADRQRKEECRQDNKEKKVASLRKNRLSLYTKMEAVTKKKKLIYSNELKFVLLPLDLCLSTRIVSTSSIEYHVSIRSSLGNSLKHRKSDLRKLCSCVDGTILGAALEILWLDM